MPKLVCGVGINDIKGRNTKAYTAWASMLKRCYSPVVHNNFPHTIDCSVCDEWLRLSTFKEWYDANYFEGGQLDKDLKIEGNTVYSPDTCCIVPHRLNSLLTHKKSNQGKLPTGVHFKNNQYYAQLNQNGVRKYLGYHDTPEQAEFVYLNAKYTYILEVLEDYKHLPIYPVLQQRYSNKLRNL